MPLSIQYIASLDAIVDEAVEFLSQPVDFFTAYKIVLPTIGSRSWLADELAKRLGSTSGDLGDGIVAGVDFSYPGSLSRLIGSCKDADDPWSVQRLTFTVLDILAETPHYDWLVQQAGGPLLAARRIADRFDRYHIRRPGMILAWENEKPVLAPMAGEVSASGEQMLVSLGRSDRWQFDLWQLARAAIDQPSPPTRDANAQGPVPSAVLVAGLEGLAFHQIELLKKLATLRSVKGIQCNVKVLLVHPSSPLRIQWEQTAPSETLGYPPKKQEVDVLQAGDSLVTSWLRGTQEAQMLLASQGLTPAHMVQKENDKEKKPATLLKILQQTISDGICSTENVDVQDESVRIHRCHDLSRQAEVIHDALLHSFKQYKDLSPHDVLIVSPRISELAPHLEAVFSRTLKGKGHEIELPLVIADRGIREVSEGAELLVALLKLVGSRCSVEDMLAVATHHLVRNHYDVDDNTLEVWKRCIERTRIRWGIDGPRRKRDGLDQPELAAHTWWQGLERMLLGILLPDGAPEAVLGGIVPLTGVDTSDIESLAPLLSIVRVIDALDRLVRNTHSVRDWCDHIEQALIQLVGDDTDALEVAVHELDHLRRCATETRVPYHDIKTFLVTTLTAAVGHQPLRTGAITATSMIPLRAVPFRVICVAGFDEDASESSVNDSDDLVERQQLLGDSDPRINIRRSFLDCVLAAGDQLVITCTGMSVSTNVSLPLITPLAEFVDFVSRHGVPIQTRDGEEYSDIEVFHPRHACSHENFVMNGIRPDAVWSHDQKALHVAKVLGATPQPVPLRCTLPPPRTLLELTALAAFMHDPLWPFVRETLAINPWRNDNIEIPATLPLELSQSEQRELRDNYIHQFLNSDHSKEFEHTWTESVQADGDVPIWGFGESAIREITAFAEAVVQQTNDDGLSLLNRQAEMLRVEVNNVQISGTLQASKDDSTSLIFLVPGAKTTAQFQRPKYLALGQLLLAKAAGIPITRACVYSQHEKWSPNAVDAKGKPRKAVMVREVILDTSVNSQTAKDLLGTLCDLYQQAAASAYSSFGKAAAEFLNDQNKSKKTFNSFVAHKSFEKSLEVVVHGRGPVFDNVFLDHERHRKFFNSYVALTHFKPRTNMYSPE